MHKQTTRQLVTVRVRIRPPLPDRYHFRPNRPSLNTLLVVTIGRSHERTIWPVLYACSISRSYRGRSSDSRIILWCLEPDEPLDAR